MEKEKSSREVPGWFKILILITALPVFAWPWLMSRVTFVFVEKAAGDALPWALVMLFCLRGLVIGCIVPDERFRGFYRACKCWCIWPCLF